MDYKQKHVTATCNTCEKDIAEDEGLYHCPIDQEVYHLDCFEYYVLARKKVDNDKYSWFKYQFGKMEKVESFKMVQESYASAEAEVILYDI